VTGTTLSPANTLPLKVGPFLTSAGQDECFVAKVTPSGSGFVYCGLLGGDGIDTGYRIAADARGHAYVAGYAVKLQTQIFPFQNWPVAPASAPHWGNGFVAKIDTTGRFLHYSGLMGGTLGSSANAIAVTPSGTAFVAGGTGSDEKSFPVTVGPDLTQNGGGDAFVAKIKYTDLMATGSPRLGATTSLLLTASDSAGLPYQVGTALGNGPIPIDTRTLGLSSDGLLLVSVHDFWPQIFVNYRGVIGQDGEAHAKIVIPALAPLVGTRLHTAFVTLDPAAPSGIRDISVTATFSITK
jgi:hypothetical protein